MRAAQQRQAEAEGLRGEEERELRTAAQGWKELEAEAVSLLERIVAAASAKGISPDEPGRPGRPATRKGLKRLPPEPPAPTVYRIPIGGLSGYGPSQRDCYAVLHDGRFFGWTASKGIDDHGHVKSVQAPTTLEDATAAGNTVYGPDFDRDRDDKEWVSWSPTERVSWARERVLNALASYVATHGLSVG